MKLVLPDALHARPANLFVRVASQHSCAIEVRKGDKRADAKNILQVLTLGAAKGDEIEVFAKGDDAESAHESLRALVERCFDADLVPETGTSAVEGRAVGCAVVLLDESSAPIDSGTPAQVTERLQATFARVQTELREIVRALPRAEAELFEPEIEIVRALLDPVLARVTRGERAEEAIRTEAASAASDLIVDARDRLLDAYANEGASRLARILALAPDGDLVLVVETLTPSLVTAVPDRVVGIVASHDAENPRAGYTSHAAILARGRGIPLLFVPPHVVFGVADGETVVLDATKPSPRLWVSPSEAKIAEARAEALSSRKRALEEEERARTSLSHLGISVRINVGSLHDHVPASADGVGLLRTELVCSGRTRAPTEDDQVALLAAIAGKVEGRPLVVRLFDAGGDKPIPWIPPPDDAPDARGIDLLRRHPEILTTQVRAIARMRLRADVRVLIPLVRDARDIVAVRALAPRELQVGAMVETPDAVAHIDAIAEASDFVCIGTNDLAALALGVDRETASASLDDPRVLALVERIVSGAHAKKRTVTVCGELAGDPRGARLLIGLGVDALSVAPARLAGLRVSLAQATVEECRTLARATVPA